MPILTLIIQFGNFSAILFTIFIDWTYENRDVFQDIFCGDGGYVRGSAPGNRETKKFRARTKNRDRRWATRIRSDNLTVCPNVRTRNFKFHYFPFEVTPPISAIPAESVLKQGLFSGLSKWEVSNNIATVTTVRGDCLSERELPRVPFCI